MDVDQKMTREALHQRLEMSACFGKEPLTFAQAERQLKRFNRRIDRHAAGKLRPYRCQFCRQWHIGGAKS